MVDFSSPHTKIKQGKQREPATRETISELVATESAPAATENQQNFDPKC